MNSEIYRSLEEKKKATWKPLIHMFSIAAVMEKVVSGWETGDITATVTNVTSRLAVKCQRFLTACPTVGEQQIRKSKAPSPTNGETSAKSPRLKSHCGSLLQGDTWRWHADSLSMKDIQQQQKKSQCDSFIPGSEPWKATLMSSQDENLQIWEKMATALEPV